MWTFFAHFSMHLHVGKHFIISTFLHLQFFLQPSRHPHFLNTVLFKFCLIKQWSCVTHWHFILLSVKDHVQFVCDSSVLAGMCNVPQIFTDTYETLWICWIKASRVGGSYRIPEFPRCLKIWYLATSTDGDISDSVTYNETKNDSINFKFSSASGNVGRLLYSRNVWETTELFSHTSQNFIFPTWKKLEV